ncbi:uncharacterized protein V2V93DRAFT_361610 [Kockiozyma suomiensis]|uniref:uncharacterized protein n=1 Tax=Kockiozyma suomiensis TaxID=1337062 RepID=UPI0033441DB6
MQLSAQQPASADLPNPTDLTRILIRDVSIPTQIPDPYTIGVPDPQLTSAKSSTDAPALSTHVTSLLNMKSGKAGFDDPLLRHINYQLVFSGDRTVTLDPVRHLENLRKTCNGSRSKEYASNLGKKIWNIDDVLNGLKDEVEHDEIREASVVQFEKVNVLQPPDVNDNINQFSDASESKIAKRQSKLDPNKDSLFSSRDNIAGSHRHRHVHHRPHHHHHHHHNHHHKQSHRTSTLAGSESSHSQRREHEGISQRQRQRNHSNNN